MEARAIDTSGDEYDVGVLNDYGVAVQAALSVTKAFDGQSFYRSRDAFEDFVEWLGSESSHLVTFVQMAKQAASVRTQPWQLMDTSRLLELESIGFGGQLSALTDRFSSGERLQVSGELRALAAQALSVIDSDAHLDSESIASWAAQLALDSVDRCD